MSVTNSGLIRLQYGDHACFSCEINARRIMVARPAPAANPQFREQLREALQHPLDFPPLAQAIIPDDRVVLALDRHTPESPVVVAEVWRVLETREVQPENVLVIQPASLVAADLLDPRSALPDDVRNRMRWEIHDATDRSQCAYLAATTSGERIYLTREVTDADIAISMGFVAYDPVLGYRGTNSVFYPGLSVVEAFARAHGQGHNELGPSDERPVRQLIDEVAWLLGTQFSIQVVPSAGGGVSHVLAGCADSVQRAATRLLDEQWMVRLDRRPDIVVAAVDRDAAGHGWEQIGAALATARNLVGKGGKILILSQLEAELGEGLKLVRQSKTPREAIKPLRTLTPPDLIAATQLANAADWADVYLLSKLQNDLVEELFFIPLESETEITRLLSGDESCAFLSSAQNTYGQIDSA